MIGGVSLLFYIIYEMKGGGYILRGINIREDEEI